MQKIKKIFVDAPTTLFGDDTYFLLFSALPQIENSVSES